MLPTDLRMEPRWRELADQPTARLVYLSFMTSSLVSYIGYFHLPLPIFAYESMIPENKLRLGLSSLANVGLIEFDNKTEFVRVDGWYNERRTPKNANILKSAVKGYQRAHLAENAVMARSIAEFTLATLKKSRTFKSNKESPEASRKHKIVYVETLFTFLERKLCEVEALPSTVLQYFSAAADPLLIGYFCDAASDFTNHSNCRALAREAKRRAADSSSLFGISEESNQRFPDHSPTVVELAANGSETIRVNKEKENRDRAQAVAQRAPLEVTKNSALAVDARRS